MSSSATSPQLLGRRMQFCPLELGVGASLAAAAALGAALFSVSQDPASFPANSARTAPPPAVATATP